MTAAMWKRALTLLSLLMCCSIPKTRADDVPAYCRRIEALAQSEGALLWAPRLSLQGLRYPSGFDNGPTTQEGYQLRVGLSYSLVDAYRALRQRNINALDCSAHELQHELETAVETMADVPLLDAFRAQARFLSGQRGELEGVHAWRSVMVFRLIGANARAPRARPAADGIEPAILSR